MDVVVVGRVGVDLYADQHNTPLAEVRSFSRYLGGSPANVAVGLSRLGKRVGIITKVGADPLGDYVLDYLVQQGLDISQAKREAGRNTSLALVQISPPRTFTTIFYRRGCADTQLQTDDVDLGYVSQADILLCSGASLAESPSRETALWAMGHAKCLGLKVMFDVDYREQLWEHCCSAAVYSRIGASLADVIMANYEEMQLLAQCDDLGLAASAVLGLGPEMLVAKLGADGCRVFSRELTYSAPAYTVEVVSALGAGDGFAAGFCFGLLERWSIGKCARFGNAVGAIVTSRLACSDAMPYLSEVKAFMSSNPCLDPGDQPES